MKHSRIALPLLILLGSTLIFCLRLFNIQVWDDRYQQDAQHNAHRVVRVDAPRGLIHDRHGLLLASNQVAYDIMATPNLLKAMDSASTAQWLTIPLSQLSKALGKAKSYSSIKPSTVLRGVTERQMAQIQESLHLHPGFSVKKRLLRDYPSKLGANVIGYVNEVNDYWLQKKPQYRLGDNIGISGIEGQYESNLRGLVGNAYITVDNLNRDKGSFMDGAYDTPAQPGQTLTLGLDAGLQALAEQMMAGKRGSVVAIDPKSGEILTMLSAPTFDPNALVGRHRNANYNRLAFDSLNKPLYNRALLAEYPPGSPFKVINALIALQVGAATPQTTMTCHDGFHHGALHVACHCGGGTFNLRESISLSCNNYYCQLLKRTIETQADAYDGFEVWRHHVESFGLGNFLGVDFPTGRKGRVPTAAYYDAMHGKRRWKAPTVISLAIGQGELVTTPIQLANMTAAIANRGYWITPHMVTAINDSSLTFERHETSIDHKHFKAVIQGMADVFLTGTSRSSAIDHLSMAGKTGTAENPHGQDHSIFIGFVPIENPVIAVAVIVENGYWGSRWAAPIGSLLMEAYVTDSISRPRLLERMTQGSLLEEYQVETVNTPLTSEF